jgi:MFS family permease
MTATATQTKAVDGSKSWIVVLAACIGMVVVAYNTTAVMTVLPEVKASLDLDAQTLQWVMNIYMLSAAVAIAAMGRFADIFGAMRIFGIALGAFTVGSLAIAFAFDAVMILAGRIFQGLGCAGIMSTSVALVTLATPEDKRSQALGLWSGAMAFGFASARSSAGRWPMRLAGARSSSWTFRCLPRRCSPLCGSNAAALCHD